jgi:hypothetical protein
MAVFIIIMRVLALVCLGSLTICGLWLGANKDKVPDYASSARFHRTLGIITVLVSAVAVLI